MIETLETESVKRVKLQEALTSPEMPSKNNKKIYFCKTCGKCFIKFRKERGQVKRIHRKSSPTTMKCSAMTKPRKMGTHGNHTCLSCKENQEKSEHDTIRPPPNKKDTEPSEHDHPAPSNKEPEPDKESDA